jgi:ribonuclease HI
MDLEGPSFFFTKADGTETEPLALSEQEWNHVVRDGIRHAMWRTAAKRRNDMHGIEHGVDRDATMALLAGGRLTPVAKGKLRSILTGAIWTQDRAYRANKAATPTCPFCKQTAEDHLHMWWHCPAWNHIRQRHKVVSMGSTEQWPNCLQVCGIMPSVWDQPLSNEVPVIDLTRDVCLEDGKTSAAERWHNSRVVVYTDGASRDNQHRALRRAGVGAFWSENHPFNISEPLQGPAQTNNRAELTAAIRVLEVDSRPVDIHTDSMYVFKGATALLCSWEAAERKSRGREISNADLWKRLRSLMLERPEGHVAFTKVKAHASWQDVASGASTAEHKHGNDCADTLAVTGAALHAIPSTQRGAILHRSLLAQKIQAMMLDILEARSEKQMSLLHPVVIDSSSSDEKSCDRSEGGSNGSSSSSGSCSRSVSSSGGTEERPCIHGRAGGHAQGRHDNAPDAILENQQAEVSKQWRGRGRGRARRCRGRSAPSSTE